MKHRAYMELYLSWKCCLHDMPKTKSGCQAQSRDTWNRPHGGSLVPGLHCFSSLPVLLALDQLQSQCGWVVLSRVPGSLQAQSPRASSQTLTALSQPTPSCSHHLLQQPELRNPMELKLWPFPSFYRTDSCLCSWQQLILLSSQCQREMTWQLVMSSTNKKVK